MRPEWHDHAACKQHPVDLFYPGRGENSIAEAAKAICNTCPVKDKCLEHALENVEIIGIWGGTSERERRRIRRARRTNNLPPNWSHGKTSGYNQGCRCNLCVAARAEYRARRKNTQRSENISTGIA